MHPKIQQWVEAEQRIDEARISAGKALEAASEVPPPEHLRKATADDVRVGNVFWYMRPVEDGGSYWLMIQDVYHPNDLFKAFCAHDGCRYGLDGAMVEVSNAKEREADAEEVCRQGDGHISHDVIGDTCIRCGKPFSGDGPHDHARQRSIDNQIAVEVDHQREEELDHIACGRTVRG